MIRHCDGNDELLQREDGTPCDCGLTFDDVRRMVTYPHHDVGGDPLPLGFRVPVPENVKAVGNGLGHLIGDALPAGWGFGLLLFTYGEAGTMFWISSAQRDDMVKALQEWMRTEGS